MFKVLPMKNSANVELLEATDSQSAIAKFNLKTWWDSVFISLFKNKNIDELLKRLKTNGVKTSLMETPVGGAHGAQSGFCSPLSSNGRVLVELSERTASRWFEGQFLPNFNRSCVTKVGESN